MPQGDYFNRRRKRLMEKDPHCHWCRRPLKLYPNYGKPHTRGMRMPADYPTIDHLKSRLFGPRQEVHMKQKTLVLSCPECNVRRSKEEQQRHIWRTRWKSGTFPFPLQWVGKLLKWYRKQPLIVNSNKHGYNK